MGTNDVRDIVFRSISMRPEFVGVSVIEDEDGLIGIEDIDGGLFTIEVNPA